MIKRLKTYFTTVILVLIFGNAYHAHSEPITYYEYLSNFEVTSLNEIIWFWNYDTLRGPLRSNDYIGIKYDPYFFNRVFVRGFRYWEAHPYFEYDPVINAPLFRFPRTFEHLRDQAQVNISVPDAQYMTRIRMRGNEGLQVYQYRIGIPPVDSLVMILPPPDRQIIRVDSELEIEGILTGELTIYSSGDIWLIDNILYEGADPMTGYFDEDQMQHMLALVSDRNIIIKDNPANGQANGWDDRLEHHDRHSIIVNGSLIALNESFTFEHHNDPLDIYQGPRPDERGYLYLKGSLAQWRRGYLQRSNHLGTGFLTVRGYDFRLETEAPPGFGPGELPDYSGYYESLMLVHGSYTFRFADVGTLIVQPGVEIVLEGQDALRVRNRLEILGTEEAPVTVRPLYQYNRSTVRFDGGLETRVDIEHANFAEGIENHFESDTIRLSNSNFQEVNWLSGKTCIDSCVFMGTTHLECWEDMRIERCVFRDGVEIRGNVQNCSFINNTVVGGRFAGIEIDRFRNLTLTGNIVAFNRQGIVNGEFESPTLGYNDVYGNCNGDYVDCQFGQGSISVDPRLIDWEHGDYHLDWGSPCIDAGDPNAPPDPDGSRSDIGAYPFHNVLTAPQPETVTPIEFGLSAAPNPFNRTIRINLAISFSGWVSLSIYDVQGRLTYSQSRYLSGGCHHIYLSGNDFGAPGVYFVGAVQSEAVKTVKVVYLP